MSDLSARLRRVADARGTRTGPTDLIREAADALDAAEADLAEYDRLVGALPVHAVRPLGLSGLSALLDFHARRTGAGR